MIVDLGQMLRVFDKLLPPTDEELSYYWFTLLREDGISIILIVSLLEENVHVLVSTDNDIGGGSITLNNCVEIRVFDEEKKCLEILQADDSKRCMVSLLGNSIVEYTG